MDHPAATAFAILIVLPGTALALQSPQPLEPHTVRQLIDQLQAEMVAVPAGSFRMGSAARNAGDDEHPVHAVHLRSFHLARFDVTEAQYALYQKARGLPTPAPADNRPAVNLSWDDAQAFIHWLNAAGAEHFRLPGEAEWEYAARAGTSTDYWWGASYSPEHANGTGVRGRDRWAERSPVGSFPPNGMGLYDMLGNVWQWTQDCYIASYQGAPSDGRPVAGQTNCGRVMRGGSWCDTPDWMRVSTRNWFDAGERFDYIGVRLAQD